MTICKTHVRSNAGYSRNLAGFTILACALTLSSPSLGHAGDVTPPTVPQAIQVPQGSKAFLKGHAVGTQNYVCAPSSSSPSGVAYTLFTPQATLYSDDLEEVTTHYFSANPAENNTNPALVSRGAIRATWRHSGDASTVWGEVKPGNASSDPAFVKQGAIGWLLLTAAGTEEGPTGGNTLTRTAFIQRVNTSGGAAPATGCASMADVGNQAWVPYTADYFFFTRP
ncbi:MAG TPA: DUF3455 domain-containing protein [Casimicrobiaceae bacterium]|nr:DUF3455 domain-containing protein [Casimicrobiaceae bacterium]